VKAKILDSSFSPPVRDVNSAEPALPSSGRARSWRLSLSVSLGVLLLLASLTIAALSLRSHAGPSSSYSTAAATSSDEQRWSSLGYVDIEGGVTPLYPVQPGRVKSIEAKENEPVKAGAVLFHLEDTEPVFNARKAKIDLQGAKDSLAIAQAKLEDANKRIEAQQTAIANAQKIVEKARLLLEKRKSWEKQGLDGDKESVKAAEIDVKQAELGVKGEQQKLAIAQTAKRLAEGYVAAARTNVQAKQIQLEDAENAVKECVVRAPVDGTPLRILVTVGQVLGSNPRQPAIQFAAERPLLVRAEVEQEFVGRVRKDQNVIIEDNVTGEECARGKVVSIARWYAPHRTSASPEMLTMNNEVRTLECIVHIESTTSREIRIGQRVRVQFTD
jgi:multidrug resistance efflux pump